MTAFEYPHMAYLNEIDCVDFFQLVEKIRESGLEDGGIVTLTSFCGNKADNASEDKLMAFGEFH